MKNRGVSITRKVQTEYLKIAFIKLPVVFMSLTDTCISTINFSSNILTVDLPDNVFDKEINPLYFIVFCLTESSYSLIK